MPKIVVIHQPHFLPWPGYFNKLANASCFVMQDDIQFRRSYFQNRTLVRNELLRGADWATVPIHARRETKISDVKIAHSNWHPDTLLSKLADRYRHSDYYHKIMNAISDIASTKCEYLID